MVSDKGIAGSAAAFLKIENKLPSLKQHKFYGLVYGAPPDEKYWAGVAADDQTKKLGFKSGTIPGGKYALRRVYDWEGHLGDIGKTFSELIHAYEFDPSRPCVEYYHGMNYMVVRVPVK